MLSRGEGEPAHVAMAIHVVTSTWGFLATKQPDDGHAAPLLES